MSERIHKLQPNRTIQLLGFDDLGASGAIHDATANSFTVSGTFRDSGDFAVLTLYDADNFYEHPRLKYLPDFNFDGLKLTFDVRYTNLMPLDSPHYGSIDWPYLDAWKPSGELSRIRLFDYATFLSGDYTAASGSLTIHGENINQYDRVTIWYLHRSFDYLVPQLTCTFQFGLKAIGAVHSVTVAGQAYSTQETSGDTAFGIATRLAESLAPSQKVQATVVGTDGQLDIRNKAGDGATYVVSSTADTVAHTLTGVSAASIASELAWQIRTTIYFDAIIGLDAVSDGATIRIQAKRPGVDGNSVTLYSVSKNSNLEARSADGTKVLKLSGGRSDATWRISLDFTSIGLPSVRNMVLTFAPPIVVGGPLQAVEWQAQFTNWTVAGPDAAKWLQVAAPGSVRVEETDSWCSYQGNWEVKEGFFSQGFSKCSSQPGDTITVRYSCASIHDLYIGTSLWGAYGSAMVSLDGDAGQVLNCFLDVSAPVNTRRKIRSNVPAGEHVVVIRVNDAKPFYFDFLEAAVRGDIPEPLPAVPWMSPALDYSTDHTFKLPPERVLWNFEQLGFAAPINEYIGVFWWNQRREIGGTKPKVTVTFDGVYTDGDVIWLKIGGVEVKRPSFPGDTNEILAAHFAYTLNASFGGLYATVAGNVLTITARSSKGHYAFTFESSPNVTATGALSGGTIGKWEVDPSQPTVLNHGARKWHQAMFAACHARSREITVACSMELVYPPADFAARFPGGELVETDVGFASLHSTHCAFNSIMLGFQKRFMKEIADLQKSVGLVPSLQMGEFVWWFFAKSGGGMGYYDADTAAAAQAKLGRPLHVFQAPTDDPGVNGGADATFLRDRLRDHAAAIISHVRQSHPDARFEILYPYDVNYPTPVGIHNLGGAMNNFVNFPVEWANKESSGFDRMKMEGLNFGAWTRNLDLCQATMEFPLLRGWPENSVRYLVPVFRAGSAWEREYLMARGLEIPVVNFWAFDHFCIFGLDTREPKNIGRGLAG